MRHLAPLATALCVALSAPAASAQDDAADPDSFDIDAEYDSAVRRAQRGDAQGAIRRFKDVAAHDPYWADAFYNVGTLSESSGGFSDCALYFRRYLLLVDDDPDADDIRRSIATCEAAIPDAGTLTIPSATPERVEIQVDGIILGTGSVATLTLPPGTYTVSATYPDYEPFSTQVEVAAGGAASVDVRLTAIPQFGGITINTVHEGATVMLNGETVGVTPLAEPLRVEVGEYELSITKDGYHPWRRNVEVLRDLVDEVDVRLLDEDIDLSRYQ